MYYNNRYSSIWSQIPVVTKNIIIINLLFFVATLINEPFMIEHFAMFYPETQYFKFWQPLTHMFMHGGFLHIFFNMYTLFLFGTVLERTLGSEKFLKFYLITGLGAVALHTLVQYIQIHTSTDYTYITSIASTPTVGASGAIFGVLMGYAMLYPDSILRLIFPPVALKAKYFVMIFAILELLMGVTGTFFNVAHFAHLGGMIFGFLLIKYWKKRGF